MFLRIFRIWGILGKVTISWSKGWTGCFDGKQPGGEGANRGQTVQRGKGKQRESGQPKSEQNNLTNYGKHCKIN